MRKVDSSVTKQDGSRSLIVKQVPATSVNILHNTQSKTFENATIMSNCVLESLTDT